MALIQPGCAVCTLSVWYLKSKGWLFLPRPNWKQKQDACAPPSVGSSLCVLLPLRPSLLALLPLCGTPSLKTMLAVTALHPGQVRQREAEMARLVQRDWYICKCARQKIQYTEASRFPEAGYAEVWGIGSQNQETLLGDLASREGLIYSKPGLQSFIQIVHLKAQRKNTLRTAMLECLCLDTGCKGRMLMHWSFWLSGKDNSRRVSSILQCRQSQVFFFFFKMRKCTHWSECTGTRRTPSTVQMGPLLILSGNVHVCLMNKCYSWDHL